MTLHATKAQVAEALRRALHNGSLRRIPRHPERRAILLALLCLPMQRRRAYAERELNGLLTTSLSRLDAHVDHVTCRRCLVDLGFVRRDRAGNRYIVNYPRLEATLAAEVRHSAVDPLDEALAQVLQRAPKSPRSLSQRPG